ncbi:MAG: sulfate ABC transporter permease subunit CysT [Anaerolineae bacterium]|nr:sulfate ABC transporter permease subunit CysT [Anaerolineae bacterium]
MTASPLVDVAQRVQNTGNAAARPPIPWGAWGLRGAALSYLGLLILLPVLAISVQGFRAGWESFWTSITRPAVLHAVGLTLWTSAVMTVINTMMGVLTAWALVNYRFPGKRIMNALIDLPFAIPALVTGVMLVLLYGPQTAIGGFFEKQLGVRIIFAPPGIVLALLFISYPFVIRAVQPVLQSLEPNQQEAAQVLGASPWVAFRRVILPEIAPAVITGALLCFARALGEFGSIIIVGGNLPMKSQTAAVYIYAQVEGDNFQGASAVSLVLLVIAFSITLGVDFLMRRRHHA